MRLKHYLSCMLILLSFVTVNAQEKKELKEGDQAPTFKYLDINGKEVSLSDLKGKYVYIDIWATWCGPCTGELPHLKELEKKMHGKKIVFVSISCDKDKAAWEPKLQGHFAEFLNNASPAGLRILSSSTCVGLRYGYISHNSGFSRQLESRTSLL